MRGSAWSVGIRILLVLIGVFCFGVTDLAEVLADRHDNQLRELRAHHEGAPVGTLVGSLVLTGHRDPGVRIIGIGVEKVQTEPVLAGTSIQLNSAGEAPSIELAANLDETRPKILSNGAPYFPGRNITLKNGEQENLKVSLTASAKLYRWTFVIDYVDEAGAAHKVFVNRLGHTFPDPSGSPLGELFTLTGAAPTYGAAWVENGQFPGFQPRT
jgi:hypothetical protein